MKTLSILTLIACLLVACESKVEDNPLKVEQKQSTEFNNVYNIDIVNIDSCEYVLCKVHYGYSITHKGNCKNTIHYGK